jgi:transcriptional regulator with XRE-family HTH domain
LNTEISTLSSSLRERKAWTQAELADRLLITRNYLSLIEGGRRAGSARLLTALMALAGQHEPGGVGGGGLPIRRVPVLSWKQAEEAAAQGPVAGSGTEQLVTTCADPRAFAVEIEGEAMLPDFKPGDRVVVAPGAEPHPSGPVLAGLKPGGLMLRLWHRLDAQTIRLSSLRPEIYPSLDCEPGGVRWLWPLAELSRRL